MSELRYTDTNAADDSGGRVFGLQGNLYIGPVLGAVVGIGVAVVLGLGLRLGWTVAGVIGALPFAAAVSWVVLLKHGKPAGYDGDFVEHLRGGGSFGRSMTESFAREHDRAPDGRFVDDLLVYGSPERGGIIAKGFWLEPADQRGASNERRNAFQEQLRGMLALVTPGRRLQVQWWPNSDYRSMLLRYHEVTRAEPDPALRAARNERFSRYWPRMLAGELRRERLAIFLSIEIERYSGNLRAREGMKEDYGSLLEVMRGQFEEFAGTLRTVFGPETPVRPMDDRDHAACVHRFLNPGHASHEMPQPGFDPERTIQENCLLGEAVANVDGGFVLDGLHHAVLALDRWPKCTRPGIVTHLTGLPFLDYGITVNLTPAVARREIDREEKAAERLRGEYGQKPRASLLVALQKKERKVQALSGGFARPFHVTYLVRVWAPTREALREKISAVQAAVNAMDGAQVFECALPTTAKKLFFASWPGWTHSSYRHRELYAEDSYLADVLPCSATFTGTADQPEAIYDGSHGNLVGVSTQVGGSPQHAVLLGMTGAGKSAFMEDLLEQTATYFRYTFIVEEGLSYKAFTTRQGETPIVVHPDSGLTLNYLDTQGLPLTQLHLATAVALLARVIGAPESAEHLALRQAQLTQYLQVLYRQTFERWSEKNPEKSRHARRLACAVQKWRERMPAGASPLEAFVDLRDRRARGDDEVLSLDAELRDENVESFAADPATAKLVAQTGCALLGPEDQPTHSALVELLACSRRPEHDKADIDRLVTLLRAWSADGPYGRLFDGVSNVSLQRRVVHFELGLIPEQAVELKVAVGLLISGLVRQHIIGLPREQRKRVIFEELARFLDVPGGETIVAESYAQLRKFNCWAISIVQQYARFRPSRIRPAVIGNAKQFFLMRQADRRDLEEIAADIALPESAVEAIRQYSMPEQLAPKKRYSSVCFFTPTSHPAQCGTLSHVQGA